MQLPPRLNGFLESLTAISDQQFDQGGLTVTFPSTFDRNDLEMIWYSGNESRSGGVFKVAKVQDIARFFNTALGLSNIFDKSRQDLAEKFLEVIKTEFNVSSLEVWSNESNATATLSIGIGAGEQEQWLELFWSFD